ncbi:MAG: leucine-rich repeat domain-containing protein [Treponema sp.]|nr:leucine-rich repeat domain-containing protein [Treponema sp.]
MKKFTWLLIVFIFFTVNIIVFAQNPASDFEFDIDAQGRVSIVRYIGTSPNVVIPREIQGFPVVEIGAFAFDGNQILQRVTIPEGVTAIGLYAFGQCRNLIEVNLPQTLTILGSYAFAGCINLQGIIIPERATKWGIGVFARSGIINIVLPQNIEVIPMYSFMRTSLQQIIIPEKVTIIAAYAFADCVNLRTVSLPSSIKSIGNRFYSDIEERHYPSMGGPDGKDAGGVFINCEILSHIIIPNNVTRIEFIEYNEFQEIDGEPLFDGCKNLSLATQARLRQLGYDGKF